MLSYSNLGQLSVQSTSELDTGELAFVSSLRDFFFLEKTVTSGSTNSIDRIAATGGGVWYRMGIGSEYWKNQLTWYIDPALGADENLGSVDAPLKTHDELVRRLLGPTKLLDDYTVYFAENASAPSGFALDVELDGGSLTYVGITSASADLGQITYVRHDVSYSDVEIPQVQTSDIDGSEELVYSEGSFFGWVTAAAPVGAYTTETIVGDIGDDLTEMTVPTWSAGLISVRGFGNVVFDTMSVAADDICVDPGATLTMRRSKLSSTNELKLYGGSVLFDRSHVTATNNITIGDRAEIIASGSSFDTLEMHVKQDSVFELGATTIVGSNVHVSSARALFSLQGSSGSALVNSDLTVGSNSMIDLRNLMSSGSTYSEPIKVTGVSSTVLFDELNVPKANNLLIHNGMTATYTWDQMPFTDMLRDVKVVSGTLENV